MKHKPLARQLTAQFYRGNLPMFALAVFAALAGGTLNLIVTWLMQQLIDAASGLPGALPLGKLAWITGGFILLCAALMLLKYASEPRFIEKAMQQYKDFAFQKLTEKSISSFRAENTAAYLSALTNDAASIEADDLSQLLSVITKAVTFFGALAMMLWYSPLMTAIAAGVTVLPLIASLLTSPGTAYDGSILLDGMELRTIAPESLYETVSLIQQNVFVFNASIRDNITMFRSFPSEELAQAVRRAQLESLLADRGEGYLCGENGSGLSGGEKQRISIARSLLKHASVLLADEATAALDAQTAHQVTDDILSLTGVTRIVVTHTLEQAALRQYDGILVLKDGRIAETGSFDELMERKGYFYALYTVSQ